MSLLHCQFSYYTDFHTVAGLLTTRCLTLSQLSEGLTDQIQPSLYFSVNNEDAPHLSKGSRVTHVTVCCIPSRKIVFHEWLNKRIGYLLINVTFTILSVFFHFVNHHAQQNVAFTWIDFRFEERRRGARFGRIFIGRSAINHWRTQSIFVCEQKKINVTTKGTFHYIRNN